LLQQEGLDESISQNVSEDEENHSDESTVVLEVDNSSFLSADSRFINLPDPMEIDPASTLNNKPNSTPVVTIPPQPKRKFYSTDLRNGKLISNLLAEWDTHVPVPEELLQNKADRDENDDFFGSGTGDIFIGRDTDDYLRIGEAIRKNREIGTSSLKGGSLE
jgi:hypothetical protein